MKSLTIRVSDEEHALMQAAAAKRFMTITGMVRAHFHSVFEADGTLPEQQTAAEPDKPRVTRRPIPTGINAWRDEIYVRLSNGESAADVAESYGVAVQVVRDKYKAARDDIQYHADTGHKYAPRTPQPEPEPEPELVYDPADPDNPTEAEQAINAEIARRKMEAMGFKL